VFSGESAPAATDVTSRILNVLVRTSLPRPCELTVFVTTPCRTLRFFSLGLDVFHIFMLLFPHEKHSSRNCDRLMHYRIRESI
jgi:hypothetical protein